MTATQQSIFGDPHKRKHDMISFGQLEFNNMGLLHFPWVEYKNI